MTGGAAPAITQTEREHAKRSALFLRAKREFAVSLCIRLATVLVGLLGPGLLPGEPLLAVVLLAGLVAAEFYAYRSDTTKGAAEQVARAIDYHDGLGWPLKQGARLNSAALVSTRNVDAILARHREEGRQYYNTPQGVGPERAVQNVKQSAWYTAQMTRGLHGAMWAMVVLGVAFAGAYFFWAMAPIVGGTAADADKAYTAVLKSASALAAATISLGLVRLALGYGRAYQAAQRYFELALDYEKLGGTASEKDAVFLLASYHTARASMPIVPEWWWNREAPRLNVLWGQEVLEEAAQNPKGARP